MVRIRRRSLAIATPPNLHNKKKRKNRVYKIICNYTYLLRYLKDIILRKKKKMQVKFR
jgi:hypothetical protein